MLSSLLAIDRKLVRDLITLRGQVIAIVLIVACGIASMVTMTSTYQSLQLSQTQYYSQYRFTDVFVQLKRAPEGVMDQIRQIPGVGQGRSRVVETVTLDVPGLDDPATGRLVSIPEQPQAILNDIALQSGRYIQPDRLDEVIASPAFVEANQLALGDTISAVINGRWQELRIVGTALSPEYLYEISGTELLPDNQRFGVFWMGRPALATAFDLDGAFNDVVLTLTPGANEQAVIFRLDQILDPYGGLGAYGRDNQVSHRFLEDDLQGLQVMAVILPVIFLGIAAFLLNMVLARLVSTQRDQIAVLKAFGYSNLEVGLHFLKLVLVVVALGALVGLGLGRWLGENFTHFYVQYYQFPSVQYQVGIRVMVTAVGVSAIAALIGAFQAVQGVVSLPPAEAMRPEPPASFKPTIVERMGLQRFLSPAGRIILRNLERRPLQALMAVVGISMAVAILVVGGYFSDATDQIMAVQFHTVQREDMTLTFTQPLSGRVRHDLAQLPGVLRVEPFRAVPVRFRYGHRTRLGSITGLSSPSTLRRLIDQDLQSVPIPDDGIVLTSKLAELLHVQIGDPLTVEVLEGARPTRQVPVAGLVDELMGLATYMNVDALNRLMQEDTSYSGAYLLVDQQQITALYSQLKQTPAVASVAQRETALHQFDETIGATSGAMNAVLMLFATIISAGVIYNAARIALSERSRELATLRIIGFTQREIAVILLGEQGALVLAAVPLGWALGYGLSWALNRSPAVDSEMLRIPFVIHPASYLFALLVTGLAAAGSALLIGHQLRRLDLIAVLKTRE
ncbi:FtsX-like permease family protein [Nodosilinea sp. P-1105]|uniref:ABC transporter permease n=1 Tax=Nodosilinea sp. P-1105 TaxID=2546229 RepID=UPI00146E550C|nr:FtsX-like permease family protein [Nodosilinea sp. P-1105]NMF84687.1 FtsX-like permease family protein [Nodosilinea sp. P-1105]